MKHWTLTQLACLLAILVLLWIGCERQHKAAKANPMTDSVTVANSGTITTALRSDTASVDTIAFIVNHSELQPGY